MPPEGFEPVTPASDGPQDLSLDHSAIRIEDLTFLQCLTVTLHVCPGRWAQKHGLDPTFLYHLSACVQ